MKIMRAPRSGRKFLETSSRVTLSVFVVEGLLETLRRLLRMLDV